MQSKNSFGADNQQERLKSFASWIVGFTDGEGCFSISIIKNSTTKAGIQIFPEFVITQGEKSLQALKKIEKYFKCGKIFTNRRHDNHNENLCRYCVRRIDDLINVIIPFFEQHKLQTLKQKDFISFKKVVKMMVSKKHLSNSGLNKIKVIISTMNRRKQRF